MPDVISWIREALRVNPVKVKVFRAMSSLLAERFWGIFHSQENFVLDRKCSVEWPGTGWCQRFENPPTCHGVELPVSQGCLTVCAHHQAFNERSIGRLISRSTLL